MNLNGILPINKPSGFTSFDVIAKLRGILKTKKIGHSGTLDPMATGVLPLFVGSATKAVDLLPKHKKRYTATCQLGITTDTLDSTGTVLKRGDTSGLTKEKVLGLLPQFMGDIKQIPPMYSAVKQDGKKLYQLARKGIEVKRKPRDVTVYECEMTQFDDQNKAFSLDILCSKGTYVRTLIDDLGNLLGCGAMMTGLVRTQSDGFLLRECLTLDEVEELVKTEKLEERLLSVDSALTQFDKITFPKKEMKLFLNGVLLNKSQVPHFETEYALVYSENNSLVGVCYLNEKEEVRSKTFFNREV